MSKVAQGADGFEWEHNESEDAKPLAGSALQEWWRTVDGTDGLWWRISREGGMGNIKYFLRLWEKDSRTGKTVLKNSGFAPSDSSARAQETARSYETDMTLRGVLNS